MGISLTSCLPIQQPTTAVILPKTVMIPNLSYQLGSGDTLSLKIFNQEAFTGEYTVDGAGNISLPLIGTLSVKNLTLEQLTERLRHKLSPDFLINPQITLQIINYRPFYILGEIMKPASYPYVNGMSYLTAVAIAGGFTYRAREESVYVIRANDPDKKEILLSIDQSVQPGDIIRVEERLF
jgi:polysaccharide export outer membrane protein